MGKNCFIVLLFVFLFTACNKNDSVLFRSDAYTIYPDKVVQDNYEARVLSPKHIVSNYRSTAGEQYSRLLTFKFSINEKDNESPSGQDHWVIINDGERESPIFRFGQPENLKPEDPGIKLPVNYEYTFRVDMRHVFEEFNENGYFKTFAGQRIAKEDFKAIYIAGGSKPLSWDFSNLAEKGLELEDPDGDGIFEITLLLNPYDENLDKVKEWRLTENISKKPQYHSEQPIVDALYNLSLEEAHKNIEQDSTLRTGAKWGGVWTRDVSYSSLLAFAFLEPEVAKKSLMKKVRRNRIIQDTGSGGAWPVSSDRTTWALAAWEIYKVTGDKDWLKKACEIIKNTLDDDYKTLRDKRTGLYCGESSFLDWREQTYPKWMSNKDIYLSENLGTNVVHYQAHIIISKMLDILGYDNSEYLFRASEIKNGINNYLWLEKRGYYAQYLYGRSSLIPSLRFEALGESLAILFEVADGKKASTIIENSPITTFGTTCIFPQIPGISPYHNNAIWPFVQAYWNLAAAKAGNEKALEHGLAAIYRACALFLSNYENMVAETGDYVGTEINSDRMLWSMAGNLAMVYRLFIGINFGADGIRFSPIIPEVYKGKRRLTNFCYRDAILDIEVEGYGNEIANIFLDGQPLENAFLKDNISGQHIIRIQMKNNSFSHKPVNLSPNIFSLTNPNIKVNDNQIVWNLIPGAVNYIVYKNGKIKQQTKNIYYNISDKDPAEYRVSAIGADDNESFTSEPVLVFPEDIRHIYEIEDYTRKSELDYTNYSGSGFSEVSVNKNTNIIIPLTDVKPGRYLLDFRYSNGTGPINTDNNCAIRSLYINNEYMGVIVMPQRGEEEWSDWGFSNSILVNLDMKKNNVCLRYENWNINMDGKINDAMLDYLRIIKID